MTSQRQTIAERLRRERGVLAGAGRRAVALVYPSPYRVGMSSLGFQQVYRLLNALPDTVAERAFLPDDGEDGGGPVLTYERGRPLSDLRVVAFSVAYELEILGLLTVLARSGVPLLARERSGAHPFVVLGGPLTFSNPLPLAPFADVIAMGEAEPLVAPLCDELFAAGSRAEILRRIASLPGLFVPLEHGDAMPELARAEDACLPAVSAIRTPEATLSSMALVEIERGCSRACTFCVMRRSSGGGMRLVAPARVLAAIPADADRVGLVGAAVSDHPQLDDLLRALVARGCEVGLSSLRADRVTPELASLLAAAGGKTLTVAADGASERLRLAFDKRIEERHLLGCARVARELGFAQLKVYTLIGAPTEADEDADELAALGLTLAATAGPRTRVVLSVSTFVPKLRTPLADAPFAGVRVALARLERVRRAVTPALEVRAASVRWAQVECWVAQGGADAGMRALAAWRAGGSFAAFKRAFAGAAPASGGIPGRRAVARGSC